MRCYQENASEHDSHSHDAREVMGLLGVAVQVEKPRAARLQLIDILDSAVANAKQLERLIRKEESHPALAIERRTPLIGNVGRHTDKVKERRRRVDEAHDTGAAKFAGNDPWVSPVPCHRGSGGVVFKRAGGMSQTDSRRRG